MTFENLNQGEEIFLDKMDFAGDDMVIPFSIPALDTRGRIVQLGNALNSILHRHQYPAPVANLLAEIMVLTVLLGSSLKFNGKFIIQTSSDGPVNMLVCDFTLPSYLRAYARFDKDKLDQAIESQNTAPHQLLGQGTLALTIDQGEYTQRYQGIVALDGLTLEEIAYNYFRQSEQIPTRVRLSIAQLQHRDKNGKMKNELRAGGILTQFLPDSRLLVGEERKKQEEIQKDHWQEVEHLVKTISNDELTDPKVPSERLLYRLFHEQGVRIFDSIKVNDQCSCSREKVFSVLKTLSEKDLKESTKNNKIEVICEFCSTAYKFDLSEFLNQK